MQFDPADPYSPRGEMIVPREVFRPVYGFEKYYEVSNYGVVFALPRQIVVTVDVLGEARIRNAKRHQMRPIIKGNALPFLILTGSCGRQKLSIAQIVLEAFVGPRQVNEVVCFIDGNPRNNQAGNLEWVLW